MTSELQSQDKIFCRKYPRIEDNCTTNENTDSDDIPVTSDYINVKLGTTEKDVLQPSSTLFDSDVSSGSNLASQQPQSIETSIIDSSTLTSKTVPGNCIDSNRSDFQVSKTKSISTKSKSTVHQVELVFVLKTQLDLVYKQLNHFRFAFKSGNRLNRTIREIYNLDPANYDHGTTQLRSTELFAKFLKFEQNYRVWRKKLKKLNRKLLNVDPYDKLYDLYESLVIGGECVPIESTIDNSIDNDRIDSEVSLETSIELLARSNCLSSQSRPQCLSSNVSGRVTRQRTRQLNNQTKPTSVAIISSHNDNVVSLDFDRKPRLFCNWEDCNFSTFNRETLETHRIIHTGDLPFRCPDCRKLFRLATILYSHKHRFHNFQSDSNVDSARLSSSSSLFYKCNFEGCDFEVNRKEFLVQHQQQSMHSSLVKKPKKKKMMKKDHRSVESVHRKRKCHQKQTSETSSQMVCEIGGCQYSTKFPSIMKIHRVKHSDERPFKCDQCVKTFKFDVSLKFHKNTVHAGKRFECSAEGCSASYKTKESIRKHIQMTHSDDDDKEWKQQQKKKTEARKSSNSEFRLNGKIDGPPPYTCGIDGCGYRTSVKQSLVKHRRVHTGERPYKCTKCIQSFSSSSNLDRHMLIHQKERRFKCKIEGCEFSTHVEQYLVNHQSVHSFARPYKCFQCEKAFKSRSVLSKHRQIHELNEPIRNQYVADVRQSIASKHQIVNSLSAEDNPHLLNDQNEDRRPFKCKFEGCKFSSYAELYLRRHQRIHTDERPYHCDHCQKSFKSRTIFGKHLQLIHHDQPGFKCSVEGCEFATHAEQFLERHRIADHGERPYKCSHCDKSFKSSSVLRKHKQRHTDLPRLRCGFKGCSYSTHRPDCLRNHENNHNNDRPHRCLWPGCDLSFAARSILSRHMQIHKAEHQFKCSWAGCQYSTHSNQYLKKHLRVHTGERKHRCAQCDKSFGSSSNLDRHMRESCLLTLKETK